MNNTDKTKFKNLFTGVGEIYDKKITKTLLNIYFDALKDLAIDDIDRSLSKHLTSENGQFFPKPADVVRHINSNQPSSEVNAEMAWAEILDKIPTVGSYDRLEMDDKQALATVIAIGGWKSLCRKTIEQLTWSKKEFILIYQNYDKTPLDQLPDHLPGRIELEKHKTKKNDFFNKLEEKKQMFQATGMLPKD